MVTCGDSRARSKRCSWWQTRSHHRSRGGKTPPGTDHPPGQTDRKVSEAAAEPAKRPKRREEAGKYPGTGRALEHEGRAPAENISSQV